MTISTISCARRLGAAASLALLAALAGCAAPPVPDAACVAFRPIYLEDGAIAALRPHRQARVEIAAHNATFERLCPAAD
jgi:hypothetical protein